MTTTLIVMLGLLALTVCISTLALYYPTVNEKV